MAKVEAGRKESTEGLGGLKQGGSPVRFPERGESRAIIKRERLWCMWRGGGGRNSLPSEITKHESVNDILLICG